MKTAILSDIHSNSLALKGVLQAIKQEDIEDILIAGDFVGYYYWPGKIFELLKDFKWEGVLGNHDIFFRNMSLGTYDDGGYEKYGHALDVAEEKMSKEYKALLFSLPEKKEIEREGRRILLCHGSPWKNDDYIYQDSPQKTFERTADLGYDFVIMGHTHYPLLKKVKKTVILNPGSVGQPRDEGSNSSWAIVNFSSGETKFKRTRFDSSEILKEIERRDPDLHYNKEVLTRKRHKHAGQ